MKRHILYEEIKQPRQLSFLQLGQISFLLVLLNQTVEKSAQEVSSERGSFEILGVFPIEVDPTAGPWDNVMVESNTRILDSGLREYYRKGKPTVGEHQKNRKQFGATESNNEDGVKIVRKRCRASRDVVKPGGAPHHGRIRPQS